MKLLYQILKSENSEENSEGSRLFTRANLVLRPASIYDFGMCTDVEMEDLMRRILVNLIGWILVRQQNFGLKILCQLTYILLDIGAT